MVDLNKRVKISNFRNGCASDDGNGDDDYGADDNDDEDDDDDHGNNLIEIAPELY